MELVRSRLTASHCVPSKVSSLQGSKWCQLAPSGDERLTWKPPILAKSHRSSVSQSAAMSSMTALFPAMRMIFGSWKPSPSTIRPFFRKQKKFSA